MLYKGCSIIYKNTSTGENTENMDSHFYCYQHRIRMDSGHKSKTDTS